MKYFIDGGANNGCSVRVFRELYDKDEEYYIYSFEADPRFAKYFNDLNKHTFINKAIWIEDTTLPFYVETSPSPGSTLMIEKKTCNLDKENPVMVPAIDFSVWFLKTFNEDDEIILKLDIEGAEYDVLEKMLEDGSFSYVDRLLIEWHGIKCCIPKERHNALIAKLDVPMEKWAGIEAAKKMFPKEYR